MKLKVAKNLLALLAIITIVFGAAPAAVGQSAKVSGSPGISPENLFSAPANTSSREDGLNRLFEPEGVFCSNVFCRTNARCQEVCGDPSAVCNFQFQRCTYL